MKRTKRVKAPGAFGASSKAFRIFAASDIAAIWRAGIPPVSADVTAEQAAKYLNDAFTGAEQAAHLAEAEPPPHERRAFYTAVREHAIALLALLRSADADPAAEGPSIMASWREAMIRPLRNVGPIPPQVFDDALRSTGREASGPQPSPSGPAGERTRRTRRPRRPRLEPFEANTELSIQLDRALDVLELLAALATVGVMEAMLPLGGKRGGGDRPDRHLSSLMVSLAAAYFRATGRAPDVDGKVRGNRSGPAARWVDDVVQMAAQKVRCAPGHVVPDATAAKRILRLQELAADTLARRLKEGWAELQQCMVIERPS
jgi:hypothetical protein